MGIDIITQKRWIRVGDRYFTMVEHGSRNWTDVTYGLNGRRYEKMSRSWTYLFGNFQKPLLTKEEIYEEMQEWIRRNNQYEYFKYCGKYIGAKEIESFVRSGIRHALSLEEMEQEDFFHRNHYLDISSRFYDKNNLIKTKFHGYAGTTNELEEAIRAAHAEAEEVKKTYPNAECYLSIEFHPRDPVKRIRKRGPKKEMPVYWVIQIGTKDDSYSFFARLSSAHYWKGSLATARKFREKEAEIYVDKYEHRFPEPLVIRKVVNGVLQ